jgi:hypothetical protein
MKTQTLYRDKFGGLLAVRYQSGTFDLNIISFVCPGMSPISHAGFFLPGNISTAAIFKTITKILKKLTPLNSPLYL